MTTPLLLVVLVSFSFAIARLLQRYASRFVVLSGAEYLVVGVLVGPLTPPRLITDETMALIQPLVSLLLGLIGLMIGLRAPRISGGGPATTVGLLSSGAVTLAVGGLFVLAADALGVRPGHDVAHYRIELWQLGQTRIALELSDAQLWLGLAIGAAAAIASPSVVSMMRERLHSHGKTGELLSTLAETSQWIGVLMLGVSLALARARSTTGVGPFNLGLSEWALVALSLGGVCGVLFSLFIGRETNPQRVFLAAVGGVIFATGVGTALGISPLFVNLVTGITVSLTSPHAGDVRAEMDRMAHPLFVLTMLLAGAMWQPVSGLLWLLPLIYIAGRLLSRALFLTVFGAALIELPPRISRGLLAQGTAAVAVALDFAQRMPEFSPLVLSTVLVGVLVSELFSHRALSALLLDVSEHELGHEAESVR